MFDVAPLPLQSHSAPDPLRLRSFFMGGFECATHIRRDHQRMDIIAATGHDRHCAEDYALLATAGIRTVRDGLRWHLIETRPGSYDWSSFLPMLHAAIATHTQVIWDLCHWGIPAGLDVFGPDFIRRFAAFARAAAEQILEAYAAVEKPLPHLYTPINEISFWSWIGGDRQHFSPFAKRRGPELKQQLVLASMAAIRAVRQVDPAARFVQPEPIIHISASPHRPDTAALAARYTEAQFEAWDMLAGRSHPELGGGEDLLDIIGTNFYWNNQWLHRSHRTPLGHPSHRPLHLMLADLQRRYDRPILLTETGTEGDSQAGWLGYIAAEIRAAHRLGADVRGICLYPVMDYPGWDNGRHCPCGLIELDDQWSQRQLRSDLVAELNVQQRDFSPAPHPPPAPGATSP